MNSIHLAYMLQGILWISMATVVTWFIYEARATRKLSKRVKTNGKSAQGNGISVRS